MKSDVLLERKVFLQFVYLLGCAGNTWRQEAGPLRRFRTLNDPVA